MQITLPSVNTVLKTGQPLDKTIGDFKEDALNFKYHTTPLSTTEIIAKHEIEKIIPNKKNPGIDQLSHYC